MKKAVGYALSITGVPGNAAFGATQVASKSVQFGARTAARAIFTANTAFLGGSSAAGIGGGAIGGASLGAVIIAVAIIIVAVALIYYFMKKREEAKNNHQEIEKIDSEEKEAIQNLRDIEKDALSAPFQYVPRPGKAGA